MEDYRHLIDYYENYNEDERLTSRHGQVEFLTTIKYIKEYLKEGFKVLDIGAGTGGYSFAIAQMGYEVDAVELVQHNVDVFKSKIKTSHNLTVKQGNALDLSFIQDSSYEITLLLGPMYHLYEKEDKLKALSEAIRITKPSGIIFISYCISDASIIDYGFKQGNLNNLIENNILDLETFDTHSKPSDLFELVRKKDIDSLMACLNTERLHYVATDGFTRHMKDTIRDMDDKTYAIYLKYHFAICENEDIVGITHHSLDVVRKK